MQSQLTPCIRYGEVRDQSSRQVVLILYNSTSTLRLLVELHGKSSQAPVMTSEGLLVTLDIPVPVPTLNGR